MTRQRMATILAGVAALAVSIQCFAAGDVGKETRQVSGFHEVVLHAVGDLVIEQGDVESLVVEAEKRLLPKIVTEVKGGRLHFSFSESPISTRQPIRYLLTVKRLDAIERLGSGAITATGLRTETLSVTARGAGKISIDALSARTLAMKLIGSADITVRGEVKEQDVTIQGSGDYHAEELASAAATLVIRGSGNAVVAASDALSATITGAGRIKYRGEPKVRRVVTGAGSIEKL
jgi:hypothetical protein